MKETTCPVWTLRIRFEGNTQGGGVSHFKVIRKWDGGRH
jgi:hypothetical protein